MLNHKIIIVKIRSKSKICSYKRAKKMYLHVFNNVAANILESGEIFELAGEGRNNNDSIVDLSYKGLGIPYEWHFSPEKENFMSMKYRAGR